MDKLATIQIVEGPLKGREQRFRLGSGLILNRGRIEVQEPDALLFGRSPDCQVFLPPEDDQLSRHHFLLEIAPKGSTIRDCGSRNGTYVNGQLIGQREKSGAAGSVDSRPGLAVAVESGDLIRAGHTVFRLRLEASTLDEDRAIAFGRSRDCGMGWLGEADALRTGPVEPPRRASTSSEGKLVLQNLVGPPRITGFDLLKKLGSNCLGASYLCRRQNNGHQSVIKVLRTDQPNKSYDFELLGGACASLSALQHENLVRVLDFGLANFSGGGWGCCLEIEYCEGHNARQTVERLGRALRPHEVYGVMHNSLSALAHAHRQGIVHGNIKPANVLLACERDPWSAKLADFALSRIVRRCFLSRPIADESDSMAFSPPEQSADPDLLSPSADVWSLGAVFYFLFTMASPWEIRQAHSSALDAPTPRFVPLSERYHNASRGCEHLVELVDHALAPDPEKRFANAIEMWKAFEHIPRPPAGVASLLLSPKQERTQLTIE